MPSTYLDPSEFTLTESGTTSGSDLSKFDWSKVGPAAGAAVGLGTAALAGGSNSDITPTVNAITKSATDLGNQGREALSPVLKYFKDLFSSDPSAVLSATGPQRGRVIDQYDAARKSIGQFTPRGGGQASGINESRVKEASDLGNITAEARSGAATNLAQVGLSSEEASVQAMSSVLQPLLAKQAQDQASTAQLYAGIGKLIGAAIFA